MSTINKKVLDNFVLEQGLCEQLLGLTSGSGACFAHQLGRCKGACEKIVPAVKYNFELDNLLAKYKLKNWWFKGPIAIKEYCPVQSRAQVHVFDQWCYLGTLEVEGETLPLEDLKPPRFDMDHYRILLRFFRQPRALHTDLIELGALDNFIA